jgi:hypothetical protein
MPPRQAAPADVPQDAAPAPRRRHYTAAYKAGIIWQYAALDRAGRTRLLRAERLRASLVSQWRAQAEEAVLQAMSGEAGGQPARLVHLSDSRWSALTEAGARLDPPIGPERLLRALTDWCIGRDDQPPVRRDAPAAADGT